MTIYALSSGLGVAGVAIIRISGEETSKVVKLLTGLLKKDPMVLFHVELQVNHQL